MGYDARVKMTGLLFGANFLTSKARLVFVYLIKIFTEALIAKLTKKI